MLTGGTLLAIALGAVGLVWATFVYLRREAEVPARGGLLALRLGAVALLLTLLLNPNIPGEDPAGADALTRAPWTVLDADPALLALDETGTSQWEIMLEAAAERAAAGDRLARVVGDQPEGLDLETLRGSDPLDRPGDPGEALLRLAELGADSLLLLSPLRRPTAELQEALSRLPVPVRVERVGGTVRNAALAELILPLQAESGEEVEGSVLLVGEGDGAGESLRVEIRVQEELVWEETVPLPETGLPRRISFPLTAPADTGRVRVEARVELAGDAFPYDDSRAHLLRVGRPEGGIVLLSLRPDWEPRTLIPVLERATGMEGEGFLRVGPDRFLPLVAGGERLVPSSLSEVVERGRTAALLVLHGTREPVPAGVASLAESHPRVLHLPHGPGGARLGGIATGSPLSGEWSPLAEVPTSPLFPYLSGRVTPDLPPLRDFLPPTEIPAGVAALLLRDGRMEGGGSPLILLREEPEGRRVVALASDFWRWGVRAGTPRDLYRNLWSGAAGWLLELAGGDEGLPVRPRAPIFSRGLPQRWEAPGAAGGSLVLEFRVRNASPEDPIFRRDSLHVPGDGRLSLPPLPPGRYRWEARGEGGLLAAGEVEVEEFLDALLRPPEEEEPLNLLAGSEADFRPAVPGGRPLATHPLPWLLLLGLLCVEWTLRRMRGMA